MQNERSASDAEMFPAGFRALGLGKVIGVPTMGAVIGTGSYTLLDGSAIRTPGTGVWITNGENMENFGVPPDVYVDNTPDTIAKRDMQIEKAVETLKAELKRMQDWVHRFTGSGVLGFMGSGLWVRAAEPMNL